MIVIKTKKDLVKFIQDYKREQRLKLRFCDCIFQSPSKREGFFRGRDSRLEKYSSYSENNN